MPVNLLSPKCAPPRDAYELLVELRRVLRHVEATRRGNKLRRWERRTLDALDVLLVEYQGLLPLAPSPQFDRLARENAELRAELRAGHQLSIPTR